MNFTDVYKKFLHKSIPGTRSLSIYSSSQDTLYNGDVFHMYSHDIEKVGE